MLLAVLLLQATFQSPRVVESSGVAASRAYPGVLWTHNDSGDGPYLYATTLDGRDLGWLLVPGAEAIDWEDIALGPCPAAFAERGLTCLYLADTGDNGEDRRYVTIYAVPEPRPPQAPSDTLRTTSAPAILRLRYPDGSHDVEAIFVAPRDTALFLVSKGRRGPIRVYRVNSDSWLKRDETATATLVQRLDLRPSPEAGRVITSAAIRRDGRLVALRTYNEIFLFYPGVGGRLTPARETPCDVAGLESLGEAIDYLNDTTLVLTSEAAGRRRPGTIHTVSCPLLTRN
jgi:hypothetical protein